MSPSFPHYKFTTFRNFCFTSSFQRPSIGWERSSICLVVLYEKSLKLFPKTFLKVLLPLQFEQYCFSVHSEAPFRVKGGDGHHIIFMSPCVTCSMKILSKHKVSTKLESILDTSPAIPELLVLRPALFSYWTEDGREKSPSERVTVVVQVLGHKSSARQLFSQ